MEKGELIKLMLEYELFEEKIFWSSDGEYFQNYLEFLYLNGGKNDEKDFCKIDNGQQLGPYLPI